MMSNRDIINILRREHRRQRKTPALPRARSFAKCQKFQELIHTQLLQDVEITHESILHSARIATGMFSERTMTFEEAAQEFRDHLNMLELIAE